MTGQESSSSAPRRCRLAGVRGAVTTTKSGAREQVAQGGRPEHGVGVGVSSTRATDPWTRSPRRRACLATEPPIAPRPTRTTVLPRIGELNTWSQCPRRWCAMRGQSEIQRRAEAAAPYSPRARRARRLFVRTTPDGSQSSGKRWFTPALTRWIHCRSPSSGDAPRGQLEAHDDVSPAHRVGNVPRIPADRHGHARSAREFQSRLLAETLGVKAVGGDLRGVHQVDAPRVDAGDRESSVSVVLAPL